MAEALFFILLAITVVSGQKPLECHVRGTCSSTFSTYTSYKSSYLDCHKACREMGPACDWFTYYEDYMTGNDNCILHEDCLEFYDLGEENVFTGRSICPLVDEPRCHTTGECVHSSPIEVTREETYDDCLLACQNNDGCEQFTYHVFSRQCLQYFVCPMVDNTNCTHCYTGQKVCDQAPELECHVPGEYTNDYPFGFVQVPTYDACLKHCQTYSEGIECKCFTFYADRVGEESWYSCTLHIICHLSNSYCTDCHSGYSECLQGIE